MSPRIKLADELLTPPEDAEAGEPLGGLESVVFRNVQVSLQANLGGLSLSVEELLALTSGQVLKLDRTLGEPVDLHLNGALVARGEIVAVDDNFAIRLIEVAPA